MEKMRPYLTLKENGTAELIIKKSQFICTLARTETEAEAKAFIADIKAKHRKATHNCFAYMIGLNDEIQRESDNGEPSGTAGVPILEVLKNLELHNVCAVVTRYFGGIKLGAGGLIRAYSNATSHAIETVGIVKKVVQTELALTVSYSAFGKLQNYLENKQINLLDTHFATEVTALVAIDTPQVKEFSDQVIDLMNGQVTIKEGQEKYVEVPYELYQN